MAEGMKEEKERWGRKEKKEGQGDEEGGWKGCSWELWNI